MRVSTKDTGSSIFGTDPNDGHAYAASRHRRAINVSIPIEVETSKVKNFLVVLMTFVLVCFYSVLYTQASSSSVLRPLYYILRTTNKLT